MFITKLDIKGFGKLKDTTINLINGLNIIYGNNEAGKSTVQTFVKAMFYGLKGGKESKEGDLPPIKRFRPWGYSSFSGYMEYTLDNGESYKIARNFENGSVKVVDSLFNDVTNRFSILNNKVCVGELQLLMEESIFEGSAFIKQMDAIVLRDGRRELISKLVNTNSEVNNELTSNNAQSILKDAMKELVGNEKTSKRPLDLIKKQLNDRYSKMQRLNEERERLLDQELRLSQSKKELEVLAKKKKQLENMLEYYKLEEDICKMQKLKRLAEEKLSEYDTLKKDIISSTEHLNQVKAKIRSIEENKDMTDHSEIIRKLLLTQKKGETLWVYLFGIIAAALSGVYSFMLSLKNNGFMYLVFLSALIECIVIFLLYFRIRKNKTTKKEIINIRRQMEDSLSKEQTIEPHNIEVKYLEDRIQQFVERNEKVYVYLSEIFGKNLVSQNDISLELEELTTTIKNKERQKQEVLRILDGVLIENSVLEQDIETLNQKCNQLNIDIAKTEVLINKNGLVEEINQNLCYISELESQKQRLEDIQFSLNVAIEALEEAETLIKKDVLPELNNRINQITSEILKIEHGVVKIGQNGVFNYDNLEDSGIVPVNSLSKGTIEQVALAFRLAMTEYYENENIRLPIILDEIFSQYDDERTSSTMSFLSNYSKNRQIILFTCKSREVEIAKELCNGVNLIKI